MREGQMGITRVFKWTVLAAALLLTGLAAAACGGGDEGSNRTTGSLVPQRANLVGSVEVDQLLTGIGLGLEDIFSALPFDSSDWTGGASGDEHGAGSLFSADQTKPWDLFSSVSRAGVFAEISSAASLSGDGAEPDYFGGLLHGTFVEAELIADLEAASGTSLVKEAYKGINVYSWAEDDGETTMSVLDDSTFAFGTGGALKDIIDLWAGDAEPVSGAVIEAFNGLGGGVFDLAVKIPQGSGDRLGSLPQLEDLPISLDFLSDLDILTVRGDLKDDSLELAVGMDFTTEEAAESLDRFITGIVSLMSSASGTPGNTGQPEDQGLLRLLGGLETKRDGSLLTITIHIPKSDIPGLFSGMTAVDGEKSETSIGDEVSIMPTANHVPEGQKVEYSTAPPTSGNHWNRWAECGWYADGLPDELITHNLEHGNIVVSYNFANPARVTELRLALDGVGLFRDWGVARAYEGIDEGQVALAAWGRLALFEGVSAGEIGRFFDAFAGILGPERIAC
ncbi:MAG: hypothetical protein BZY83_02625 [SAR202 cluster bacterium Casp-Chloro-G2]|nr:DUF3105 domain-containing protein [Chloroflexota bacterium]PKB59296.1 MAG: hypothetical protein BZY83_02625 [SAR202 cluster bacterium Casp-Chloro-G2]